MMRLDRTRISRAALDLLNEVGLEGVTVRRVAERLGVQNPALYWHFKNKRDLLNSMAETMLNSAFSGLRPDPASEASVAASSALHPEARPEQWPKYLRELVIRFYDALVSHRDGARVVAEADLSESILQEKISVAQQVMGAAGFDPDTALLDTVTLLDFALGAAFEGQAEPDRDGARGDEGEKIQGVQKLDLGSNSGLDFRRAGFLHGVELILSGIFARRARRKDEPDC